MSGIYTPIETGVTLGAGASATLYVYAGNIPQFIAAVKSTVNCQIDVTDGFGSAPLNSSGYSVPHTLDAVPSGVFFSTGAKSYLSKPKVAGTSITSIAFRSSLCGPWYAITVGNQELVAGTVDFLSSIL